MISLLWIIIFVFGAIIGSFLNVVIYRVPLMLKQQWRDECLLFLNQPTTPTLPTFNLLTPRSHCTACKHPISWWLNIPIIGYFLAKMRCSHCNSPISYRYSFIETLTAVLTCFLASHYGFNLMALYTFLFTGFLLVIFFIDMDHLLIPDQITLTLLWLGLIINSQAIITTPMNAIIGASAGYLVLWLTMSIYKLLTKKIGMGHGDFKLLAAIGGWLGWQALPMTLLLAALLGSIMGISCILWGKANRQTLLPFGPYLVIGGWTTLIWGDTINAAYLTLIGWY